MWEKVAKNGEPHYGNGKTTQKCCETAWLAWRGNGLKFRSKEKQLIKAPKGPHSRKPDESYTRLERMFGEVRRIDLFSRWIRPGWTSWGNEVPAAALD